MKTSDVKVWFDQLSRLSRGQQERVKQRLGQVVPQSPVVNWLEHFPEPICPICQADHPYRWSRPVGLQRFRCRQCKHTLTIFSGTPLPRLRRKDQW